MKYRNHSQQSQRGFTVFELLLSFVILTILTVFFVMQRGEWEATARDQMRKTAINAFYYALTEDFFARNQYYPTEISRDNLKSVDPQLFTDPTGYTLHGDNCVYTDFDDEQATEGICDYHYEAKDCSGDGKCKSFVLTADMETEDQFQKTSPEKDRQ